MPSGFGWGRIRDGTVHRGLTLRPAHTIIAVIVSYNPDLERLYRLLQVLSPQVAGGVVVDNGSALPPAAGLPDAVELLALDRNIGVAAAQNVGIVRARKRGAEAVLLMDQDSLPEPDMVARLVAAWRRLELDGVRVAAVGPDYADPRLDHGSPFHRVEGWRTRRPCCEGSADRLILVDHLTASGSLIPCAALDAVGGMCETLFIDYVDVEWGLRAGTLGFCCYGVCGARMRHPLGAEPLRLLGRRRVGHPPLRNYYYFRNGVRLLRDSALPRRWRLIESGRLLRRFLLYLLAARPLRPSLSMISRGLWHGLVDRRGPWPGQTPDKLPPGRSDSHVAIRLTHEVKVVTGGSYNAGVFRHWLVPEGGAGGLSFIEKLTHSERECRIARILLRDPAHRLLPRIYAVLDATRPARIVMEELQGVGRVPVLDRRVADRLAAALLELDGALSDNAEISAERFLFGLERFRQGLALLSMEVEEKSAVSDLAGEQAEFFDAWPTAVSHNDVCWGNMAFGGTAAAPSVRFIDFSALALNARGADCYRLVLAGLEDRDVRRFFEYSVASFAERAGLPLDDVQRVARLFALRQTVKSAAALAAQGRQHGRSMQRHCERLRALYRELY